MRRRSSLRPRGDVLLAAIAALVAAVTCFAPLHQHAMIEAFLDHELDGVTALEAGLRLESSSTALDASDLRVTVPVDHDLVLAEVPEPLLDHTAEPVLGVRTSVSATAPDGRFTVGPLLHRDGACEHLAWTSGRCPQGPREVAVSRGDAEELGWGLGDRIRALEALSGGVLAIERGYIDLRVVGVYEQADLGWWEAETLTGTSGTPTTPRGQQVLHDAFVVSEAGVLGARRVRWADATHRLDLRLERDDLDSEAVDRLGGLARTLVESSDLPYETVVRSSLPEVADAVDRARSQAGVVVPLLVAQVALVGWVMLAVALQASATQRRPRVAVARLRGHGVGASRRLLAGELLPPVLVGLLLGTALALPLAAASRRWVLPPGTPLALPSSYWLAAAAAAVVVAVTVGVVAHATARVPLADLLRRSPAQRPAAGVGVGTAAVVAVAVALAAAVWTGGVSGPVALVVPAVVALAAGLLLARALTLLAVPAGRRLLATGRPHAGLGLLHLARRPATVQVASLLTVGVALLVFAIDAHATAERNRELAARQELGAPVRLVLAGRDVGSVRQALSQVDPAGTVATPVVLLRTPAAGTTVGVVPEELRRIGFVADDARTSDALAGLEPPDVPVVEVTGTRVEGTAEWTRAGRRARSTAPRVTVVVVPRGGSPTEVEIGVAPLGSRGTLGANLPCRKGCVLTGISLTWDVALSTISAVDLTDLAVDGVPVDLGAPEHWTVDRGAPLGFLEMGVTAPGAASLDVTNFGATGLLLRHAVDPAVLPAVLTRQTESPVSVAQSLGSDSWPLVQVGSVARVPGVGNDSALVDLQTLVRRGERVPPSAEVVVLVADPGRVDDVREALAARGQPISDVRTLPEAEADLTASVPGWSLQLALLVGGAGLLLSAAALLLVAATSRRARARDLAALRLTGTPVRQTGRVARWEVVPMVAAATLVGAVCGVLGASSTLPAIPLFAEPPEVSTLDLSTPWAAIAAPAAVAAVALLLVALGTARDAVRRARPDLVRSAL